MGVVEPWNASFDQSSRSGFCICFSTVDLGGLWLVWIAWIYAMGLGGPVFGLLVFLSRVLCRFFAWVFDGMGAGGF